jgi:hypothetical protein
MFHSLIILDNGHSQAADFKFSRHVNTHALSNGPLARRTYSLRSGAKNGGSEGSARQSAIHYQLDRVDVRRIVRGKKKHGLG